MGWDKAQSEQGGQTLLGRTAHLMAEVAGEVPEVKQACFEFVHRFIQAKEEASWRAVVREKEYARSGGDKSEVVFEANEPFQVKLVECGKHTSTLPN